MLFDRTELYRLLRRRQLHGFAEIVARLCNERLDNGSHGSLKRWKHAWDQLPIDATAAVDVFGDAVRVVGQLQVADAETLRATLKAFHPWRKGPFKIFDQFIDTEWKSNIKWDRFAQHIDFANKNILDIGCGNGYYGWRMINAGADFVIGCDPTILYNLQYEVVNKYADKKQANYVIPLADSELPTDLKSFDLTFSMGVLYHRTSPIHHLQTIASTLVSGGTTVIETLIIESPACKILVPADRYAKMRNVWFIPSLPMLERWLQRTGFQNVRVIDVSPTSNFEQRKTDWMTFESLTDFLDPSDARKTLEGYPAPVRAIVIANLA